MQNTKVDNDGKYMHRIIPELLVFFVWHFPKLRYYFCDYCWYYVWWTCFININSFRDVNSIIIKYFYNLYRHSSKIFWIIFVIFIKNSSNNYCHNIFYFFSFFLELICRLNRVRFLYIFHNHVIFWWWIDKLFLWYVDPRKAFSLISSRDHCQRSSPSRISNTPRAGFEPVQNLSSGLAESSCAVVITTTPWRHLG